MTQEHVYSVSEITQDIKRVISEQFPTVWIEGELSGYKRHTSGHHYFTLKDSAAQIACAMWRSSAQRLIFQPEDGMKVQAWGNLEVYEPQGRYQLIVIQLRLAGVGQLQQAFEALVKKLRAEGLFALERKRPLPAFPERIGLVTSADGAALHDMRIVAARRWPAAKLVLAPVRVQGAGAAEEIAAAIDAFNRKGGADVLIVGRGGGSLEDLWAFNEEVVARAIFRSQIPVVSAVGHEVDVTVADFVADVRAPTPSAAMEMVLPDREEVAARLMDLKRRLTSRRTEYIKLLRHRLTLLTHHWALRRPINMVHMAQQRVDELQSRLAAAFAHHAAAKKTDLDRVRELLMLFRPQAILDRGYSIVRGPDGKLVRDARTLTPSASLSITFARGGAEAQVLRVLEAGDEYESA
jgi:exodeoxyribonuclease VII large subunit